jgi:hypothetical protein
MAALKDRIGTHFLKRKKKTFQRKVVTHNFETAKDAVILFEAMELDTFKAVKEFREFVVSKGITCLAYGYVPQKEVPQEMLFRKQYSFMTAKDLNWYRKPGGEVVESFYAEVPDMLFDFTSGNLLELKYLVQLSRARFKIGCFTEEENDYDLMISVREPCAAAYLAEQFKHYISMINPIKQ